MPLVSAVGVPAFRIASRLRFCALIATSTSGHWSCSALSKSPPGGVAPAVAGGSACAGAELIGRAAEDLPPGTELDDCGAPSVGAVAPEAGVGGASRSVRAAPEPADGAAARDGLSSRCALGGSRRAAGAVACGATGAADLGGAVYA